MNKVRSREEEDRGRSQREREIGWWLVVDEKLSMYSIYNSMV